MVMGTTRQTATAAHGIHEMTVPGIHEMTADRQMAEVATTTAKMAMKVETDEVVDLRMAEDPQGEDLTTVPGLAPGSVEAMAASARSKTPSRFRHCRRRRRIASHGFAPSTVPCR